MNRDNLGHNSESSLVASRIIAADGTDGLPPDTYSAAACAVSGYPDYANEGSYHIHGPPVVWSSSSRGVRAYVWSEQNYLRCYRIDGNAIQPCTPTARSAVRAPAFGVDSNGNQKPNAMPGGTLSLSAAPDGSNAIIWANIPAVAADAGTHIVRGRLRAFDAVTLQELWNSDQFATPNQPAPSRDALGNMTKFVAPTIANGRVYIPSFINPGSATDNPDAVTGTLNADQMLVYGLNSGFKTLGGDPKIGNCLNIVGAIAQGTALDSERCSPGSPQQAFTLQAGGHISPSTNLGLCIDIQANNPALRTITLEPCGTGNAAQNWTIDSGRIEATQHSGQCLDVQNGSSASGAGIDIWGCNSGSAAQLFWPYGFTVQFRSDLQSGGTSECLDVFGNSMAQGATMDNYFCGTTNQAQLFTLDFRSRITRDGLCLEVDAVTSDNHATLSPQPCFPDTNGSLLYTQQFYYSNSANALVSAYFEGLSSPPQLCVDVSGGNSAPSTHVGMYSCNQTPAQQWFPKVLQP